MMMGGSWRLSVVLVVARRRQRNEMALPVLPDRDENLEDLAVVADGAKLS